MGFNSHAKPEQHSLPANSDPLWGRASCVSADPNTACEKVGAMYEQEPEALRGLLLSEQPWFQQLPSQMHPR